MAIYMWREFTPPSDRLYFEANTANSTIALNKYGSPTAVTLETSTDGGNWSTYTFGNTITLANIGDKVYFRNTSETTTAFSTSSSNYYQFGMTGSILASGDITYLLNKNATNKVNGNYCFYFLFNNCTSLTSCPSLPATTLTIYCYQGMFYNCTNLETLPKLPATTITDGCYYDMFNYCSKIKLSTTKTGAYQTSYRIPTSGSGSTGSSWNIRMFDNTGGTFTGNPTINTKYYTSNTVI